MQASDGVVTQLGLFFPSSIHQLTLPQLGPNEALTAKPQHVGTSTTTEDLGRSGGHLNGLCKVFTRLKFFFKSMLPFPFQ